MFCDGKCVKGNKKCGLLVELVMEHGETKKVDIQTKCAMLGILESLHRQEQGSVRIQAAVESSRNESVKVGEKVTQVIAKGFGGLIDAAKDGQKLLEGE